MIKSKADVYNKLLQSDDNRLTDESLSLLICVLEKKKASPLFLSFILVRSDINAAIGEVNLLLRGKLKQFRGLCQANVVGDESNSISFFSN